jgi:hypothetical protein
MTKTEAVAHTNSVRALAEMLEITVQAVYDWPEIIPEAMAARLEKLTEGQLAYDHIFYMNLKKEQKQAA